MGEVAILPISTMQYKSSTISYLSKYGIFAFLFLVYSFFTFLSITNGDMKAFIKDAASILFLIIFFYHFPLAKIVDNELYLLYFFKWSKITKYKVVKLYTYSGGVPALYIKIPENRIVKRVFIPMAGSEDIDLYKYLKMRSESLSSSNSNDDPKQNSNLV